ncbi:hypothetical protein BDQ12DRAFT_289853 [Crucibulum laeve]|uniref:Uncharacterized protein n=1 Tax=Crucibulum laeve TaxID=68775 RepID=A0A5C3MDK2_9AGAR|nr:hypothetical protein BDQ12DRAFT_289853 [Crucibulum laeve]
MHPQPTTHLILGTRILQPYDQLAQLRDSLTEKERYLARIDQRITQTRALLKHLVTERHKTQASIYCHRELLHPIRRIPLELLQEIFISCLSNDQYLRPNPHKAPLSLTQVCTRWRQVSFATPTLWSSLAIQLSKGHTQKRLCLIESWLSRSGCYPISLFAYLPSADDNFIAAFFHIFNSHRHHCRNLRLTLPHWCHVPLLSVLNLGMPVAKTLQIRFLPANPGSLIPPPHQLIINRRSAPNLAVLQWSSPGLQPVILSVSFAHIHRLDVDYRLSIFDCLKIMRNCPDLVECEFRAITEWDGQTDSDGVEQPITLASLRSLALHAHMTRSFGILFDHSTFPALQALKVVDLTLEPGAGTWVQSSFDNFIARSHCALQTLQLLNVLSTEQELIQCLRWTSNSLVELRILDLKGIAIVKDGALELLTVKKNDSGEPLCVCPLLESLKLGSSLSSTDGVLANMVESRWDPRLSRSPSSKTVSYLKSINPRLDTGNHPEDIKRLDALRGKGLELS